MKLRKDLIIDIIALVVYLIAANPLLTGLAVHEWVSLGIIVVFLVHVISHYDAIVETFKRKRADAGLANVLLDVVILFTFMAVTVSGLMVSRHILPLLGFVAPHYFFWNSIHSISAKVLLALFVVHLATHWRWFIMLWKGRKGKEDKSGKAFEENVGGGERGGEDE